MTDKQYLFAREVENTKSNWMCFDLHSFTGKTYIFDVHTEDKKIFLGQIKWFGRWHRYSFFPAPDTAFEHDCLRSLADLVERMTKDHNLHKKKPKPSRAPELPEIIDTPGAAYHNASLIMGSSQDFKNKQKKSRADFEDQTRSEIKDLAKDFSTDRDGFTVHKPTKKLE